MAHWVRVLECRLLRRAVVDTCACSLSVAATHRIPPAAPSPLPLAQERRKLLSSLLDNQCTFKPSINRGRPSTARHPAGEAASPPGSAERASSASAAAGEGVPIHERLYHMGGEKERRLRAKAAELEQSYTFAPQLTAKALALKKADAEAGRNPHESLYERVRRRAGGRCWSCSRHPTRLRAPLTLPSLRCESFAPTPLPHASPPPRAAGQGAGAQAGGAARRGGA